MASWGDLFMESWLVFSFISLLCFFFEIEVVLVLNIRNSSSSVVMGSEACEQCALSLFLFDFRKARWLRIFKRESPLPYG